MIVVVVGLASLTPKSKPQSVNELPAARFAFDANNLTVEFNASASSDPDGTIANYSWSFGDQAVGFGVNVTHTYGGNGTYETELTVTDDKGGKNSSKKSITVSLKVEPAASSPKAVIVIVSVDYWTVTLSGEDSKPPKDGSIVSYSWTFGDDKSATGARVTHTYPENGTYKVTLVVTDDKGATDTASISLTVLKPWPLPPKAVIAIVSVDNWTVTLSGEDSVPPKDGEIVSYSWTFGDGSTATGARVTHTYSANGTYKVTLVVTSDKGATDSTTISLTVTKPPPPEPPEKQGPPGLLRAIEIHKEKADRNHGLQNSLDRLIENLEEWLDRYENP